MAVRRKQTEPKITFSVYFPLKTDDLVLKICEIENKTTKAEVIRDAFDFYVATKYPQLLEE